MKKVLLIILIIATTIVPYCVAYRSFDSPVSLSSDNFILGIPMVRNYDHENTLDFEKLVLDRWIATKKVEIFINPDSAFEVVSRLMLSANNSVDIMIYEMWSLDFYDIIDNITQRGVEVRVLFEGDVYGTNGDEHNKNMSAMLYELNQTGRPIWIRHEINSSSYLHAKMIIIDNSIVIVGSENYVPTSYPRDPSNIELWKYYTPARGWGAVIYDPEFAVQCKRIFDSIFFSDEKSRDYDFSLGRGYMPSYYGTDTFNVKFSYGIIDDVEITLVSSPNNSYDMIGWLIDRANHTIFIEAQYISNYTDVVQSLIDKLKAARNRGVTVQIILEDDFSGYGNYSTMGSYLNSMGLHTVPAFNKSEILFLHNKGIIVDDEYVLISSINWSGSALLYNTEIGVIIRSRQVAKFFKECFAYDWNLSSDDKFDSDGDGLSDYYEIEHGLDAQSVDSDGDGLDDYSEVFIYNTDPTEPDVIRVNVVEPQNMSYINSTNVTLKLHTAYQDLIDSIKIFVNGSLEATISPNVNEYTLALEDQSYYNVTVLPVSNSVLIVIATKTYFWVDTLPPKIIVKNPKNNSKVSQAQIILSIDVWDYSPINVEIYVNSSMVFQSSGDKKYNISLQINLTAGMNIVKVRTKDAAGNMRVCKLYVTLEEATENLTTTTPGQNQTTIAYEEIVNLIITLTMISIILIIVVTIILAKRKTISK